MSLLLIFSEYNMQLISLEGPYRPLPDCQSALDGSLMQLLKFKPPSIVYVTLQCHIRELMSLRAEFTERGSLPFDEEIATAAQNAASQ